MIRDILVPELTRLFPDHGLQLGVPPEPIAVFPAKHLTVGDVTIWDDGDEATVPVGRISHGHFNPYNRSLSQDEVDQRVTEEVVGFLEQLFQDRVLLWVSKDGQSGGWSGGFPPRPDLFDEEGDYYVWSGPIDLHTLLNES